MAGWAEKERMLCARIAAIHIDRRLEAKHAASRIHPFPLVFHPPQFPLQLSNRCN